MRHWWLAVAVMGCVLLGCAVRTQSDTQRQALASSPQSAAFVSVPEQETIVDGPLIREICQRDKSRELLRPEEIPCLKEHVSKLPPIDPKQRDQFGAEYDPAKYLKCRLTTMSWAGLACDVWIMRRHPQPEYWPYPEVAKPKLPEAPQPPVYREGMSAEEYFHALCKAEAGEFIYRVVENVEGLYQIRPRRQAGYGVMNDQYVMEDPYGYTAWEAERVTTIFIDPPGAGYKYFERPRSPAERTSDQSSLYVHYSGYVQDKSPMQREFVSELKSRYGYTWREIKRPKDRELGISGGELIVVDLKTNEVLGIRRGFARTGFSSRVIGGVNWEATEVCPRYPGPRSKRGDFSYWFISKVIQPIKQTQ